MGDRANVRFIYDYPKGGLAEGERRQRSELPDDPDQRADIFFYTHWGGSELPRTVAEALKRGTGRWDDEAYLARIIFSEMVKDEVLQETGYGIAPYQPDNEHSIVEVDARLKTVNGVPFDQFITDPYAPFGGEEAF